MERILFSRARNFLYAIAVFTTASVDGPVLQFLCKVTHSKISYISNTMYQTHIGVNVIDL